MTDVVIDVGNTRAKLGIFVDGQLLEVLHFDTDHLLNEYLSDINYQRAMVCSVNQNFNIKANNLTLLDNSTKLPFRNLYSTTKTLGYDRIAAVAGAQAKFPSQPALVIDIGTCMTFEYLNAEGEYEGGAISPGIALRFQSMNNFTSKLPLINEGFEHFIEIGDSTQSSMISGVMNGILLEMEGRIKERKMMYPELKVILCGGSSKMFESKINTHIFVEHNLVLLGLYAILEFNVG